MLLGDGFFRPDSRPARDLGVLLARTLAAAAPLRVLDLMAGCGIRSLRYGLEAGAAAIWANDADPDRLSLLQGNLKGLSAPLAVRCTSQSAQQLLAGLLQHQQRFELVDLDAFGCPSALVPLALEAVAFGGVLYLASSDGRSPTGHDRPAAVRRLGAAARAHPASWELALRLQLGVVARSAWALGRGVVPLVSFSDGRTFRTAVRLSRSAAAGEERGLGMLAHCHGCGHQQAQSLLRQGRWAPCGCESPAPGTPGGSTPLAVSGPLWIGPLQHPPTLVAMAHQASNLPDGLCRRGSRLLQRLAADPGRPALCWPMAVIARRLGQGPPPLGDLVQALRAGGFTACVSGIQDAQLRSDAPWARILETAAALASHRSGRLPDRNGC